jgi:hypothetical protein
LARVQQLARRGAPNMAQRWPLDPDGMAISE